MVSYSAGETRNPERTIPRALIFGVLIVTACYTLLKIAAYLYVMPLGSVATSTRVAAEAMERVLGPMGGKAITVVIIVSALGSLNGIALAGPRVYYAMAQDRLAFQWMAALHPKRQTPYLAIAAQAVWSCVLAATNSYRGVFTEWIYTEWLFFALLAAGIFLQPRRGQYEPKFSLLHIRCCRPFHLSHRLLLPSTRYGPLRETVSLAWACFLWDFQYIFSGPIAVRANSSNAVILGIAAVRCS